MPTGVRAERVEEASNVGMSGWAVAVAGEADGVCAWQAAGIRAMQGKNTNRKGTRSLVGIGHSFGFGRCRRAAAHRFGSPAAGSGKTMISSSAKLTQVPLRTRAEGGQVQPVLGGIANAIRAKEILPQELQTSCWFR